MDEMNEKNKLTELEDIQGIMPEDKIRKKKKGSKTKVVASVLVLLLAVGIGGNWYWENSDISSKISSITSSGKTLGEATFVDATTEVSQTTESEYFSTARVERQTARDETLETLQAVIDSESEDSEAHKVAAEKIAAVSSYIEIENKIETLVQAKGVQNCLAVVSEDGTRVDVIIDSEELTDALILQIKEIATSQLDCGFENVTIIQSNN
ncbi:MAG: SpoIIIAH-like family protein [Eubacterium sp.]